MSLKIWWVWPEECGASWKRKMKEDRKRGIVASLVFFAIFVGPLALGFMAAPEISENQAIAREMRTQFLVALGLSPVMGFLFTLTRKSKVIKAVVYSLSVLIILVWYAWLYGVLRYLITGTWQAY